jgi:hypothetical protein
MEEMCITEEQFEVLVKKIQSKNPFYTKDTIRKALVTCCKLDCAKKSDEMFEKCVEEFSRALHLIQNP